MESPRPPITSILALPGFGRRTSFQGAEIRHRGQPTRRAEEWGVGQFPSSASLLHGIGQLTGNLTPVRTVCEPSGTPCGSTCSPLPRKSAEPFLQARSAISLARKENLAASPIERRTAHALPAREIPSGHG